MPCLGGALRECRGDVTLPAANSEHLRPRLTASIAMAWETQSPAQS